MSTPEVWTIQKLVDWTAKHFAAKGLASPRLDTELLLAKVLDCRRLDLYLKFDQPLKPQELSAFKELVKRRSQREPVAYILGEKEFYGRNFSVGPGVLIPRPETEHLVDEVLSWAKQELSEDKELKILDVGCGTGCIGITLALELPKASVTAVDSSTVACRFTEANAHNLGAAERMHVFEQDFEGYAASTTELFDVVVSNPPYVGRANRHQLQADVRDFEPEQALYGGEKGAELLARWMPHYVKRLRPSGLLVFEIGADQGDVAKELAKEQLLTQARLIQDYSGHSRILRAIKGQNG